MKLLYCRLCGDIVAPLRVANKPRACACGSWQVWWGNPVTGVLRVYTADPGLRRTHHQKVAVIGMHNALLSNELGYVTHAKNVNGLLDAVPASYIFSRDKAGSLAAVFYVGYTSDTGFADALPGSG